ncbi:MAG: response regulator, partial [Gemmatimonadaceae bacterium]|nr:response regulator [Gemmatimonadaceae bacterium]
MLVVDDDRTVRETLVEFFETFLWTARGATSAAEARRILEREVVDVLLLDLRLPDGDGLRVLDALRQEWPDLAVIVLTGHADIPTAVRSVQRGAIDLLEKPVDLEVLAATVRRALAIGRLQQEVEVLRARSRVVPATRSAVIGVALDASLDRAARSDAPVLLLGERGSGRGFVARVIHDRSNRASGPFIDIDCAASGTDSFITELLGDRGRGRVPGKGIRRGLLPMVGGGSLLLEQADVLVDEARHALVNALRDNGFGRPISQIGDRPAARLLASVTS